MPDTTRTFIGIGLPSSISQKVERLQKLLEPLIPEARWTGRRPFHITLAFLGDVSHVDLNQVCRVVHETAGSFAPFEIQLEALGSFPNPAKARVIWTGLGESGLEPLERLQTLLLQRLTAIGQPVDIQAFRPHVTLGRLKPKKGAELDVTAPLTRYKGWNTPTFTVAELFTFGSPKHREATNYDTISRAPFSGSKSKREA